MAYINTESPWLQAAGIGERLGQTYANALLALTQAHAQQQNWQQNKELAAQELAQRKEQFTGNQALVREQVKQNEPYKQAQIRHLDQTGLAALLSAMARGGGAGVNNPSLLNTPGELNTVGNSALKFLQDSYTTPRIAKDKVDRFHLTFDPVGQQQYLSLVPELFQKFGPAAYPMAQQQVYGGNQPQPDVQPATTNTVERSSFNPMMYLDGPTRQEVTPGGQTNSFTLHPLVQQILQQAMQTNAAPQGAVRTAINPQTGQRIQLVNGQWIPVQ